MFDLFIAPSSQELEPPQNPGRFNQFYLEAFNHALVVVGIVFGLVGVVVPAGIAVFQARQARNELEQLKRQVSSEVAAEVSSVIAAEREAMLREQASALTAFQERSDKVVADLREEVNRELAALRGSAFHVQAVASSNAGHSVLAVKSACNAIPHYIRGKDYANLRTVCANIAIVELKRFDAGSLGKAKDRFIESCEDAITEMKAADHEGNLSDLVRDLRYELEMCLQRNNSAEAVDAGNDGQPA